MNILSTYQVFPDRISQKIIEEEISSIIAEYWKFRTEEVLQCLNELSMRQAINYFRIEQHLFDKLNK